MRERLKERETVAVGEDPVSSEKPFVARHRIGSEFSALTVTVKKRVSGTPAAAVTVVASMDGRKLAASVLEGGSHGSRRVRQRSLPGYL